jgi:D-sedoheptulose 7-phosphate isomerase
MPEHEAEHEPLLALVEPAELALRGAQELGPKMHDVFAVITASLRSGGKVLACDNGGSAADAQHLVAEIAGRLD